MKQVQDVESEGQVIPVKIKALETVTLKIGKWLRQIP